MIGASDANVRTKLNATGADILRLLTQAGSKVRTKLNTMTPADRATFFMAIDAARQALDLPVSRLCVEATVSIPHYERLVRAAGRGVTARLITTLFRALKTLQAGAARGALRDQDMPVLSAAYQGCLSAVWQAFDLQVTPKTAVALLSRRGEFNGDAAWREASEMRRRALYLASTELGLRGSQLAAVTGLTPAAVSIALGKVEDRMDDPQFEAAMQRAADLVRKG